MMGGGLCLVGGPFVVVLVFHGGDGLCLEQRDTYMEMTNVL